MIGRHQALSQEVKLDWCRANGLEIARRITGGGALFMGPGLLGWELVFARATLGPSGRACRAPPALPPPCRKHP